MLSRRALLASPLLGTPKPIRTAVYGTGHAHALGKIAALKSLPQFELVGVCEPDPSRPRLHKSLQRVRWLSQRELLEDPSIKLIAVESRVQDNLAYARQAINAGKFVHLDKAPGTNLAAFRELLLVAAPRQKRIVQLGYQWRYHPAMNATLEAARQGWLGEIYSFRARIDKPISAPERKDLAALRGGMMFELGCHLIDRATDLLGRPAKVTGHLWHHGPPNDALADNTLAILEFPRAVAEISVAAMHPHGNVYRTIGITGTNGSATVRPFAPYRLSTHLSAPAGPYPSGRKDIEFPADRWPSFAPDFLEMERIIRHGANPTYSAQHDLMTQEALLQACRERI